MYIKSMIHSPFKEVYVSTINLSKSAKKQELQEVLKFPIEKFWNLEASLKSELLYF